MPRQKIMFSRTWTLMSSNGMVFLLSLHLGIPACFSDPVADAGFVEFLATRAD